MWPVNHGPRPTLRTEPFDIRLVRQTTAHAEGLFAALSDPRIYQYLDEYPPASVQAVEDRIKRLMVGGPPDRSEVWLNWSVFLGPTIIGYTQATIEHDHEASIAYVLSPEVWGTGIAQRATELMIEELQSQHSIAQLTADTDQDNFASQGLLLRLAFAETHREGRDVFYRRDVTGAERG
ncbi:GNAT family N-acetyltransferase [Aliiroseovarius sp. 2305UL8-7]|uniref:GNAT family N-acetyltransferase n=1 Tax=Aliiroseovarius conchicola TaxID=3121637 RepID=UPI003528960C